MRSALRTCDNCMLSVCQDKVTGGCKQFRFVIAICPELPINILNHVFVAHPALGFIAIAIRTMVDFTCLTETTTEARISNWAVACRCAGYLVLANCVNFAHFHGTFNLGLKAVVIDRRCVTIVYDNLLMTPQGPEAAIWISCRNYLVPVSLVHPVWWTPEHQRSA